MLRNGYCLAHCLVDWFLSGGFISASQILPGIMMLALLFAAALPTAGAERPKVRTVTAFIRLDAAGYRQQVTDTVTMLRAAKVEFEKFGYEVQTIRIATQPFGEYTRGMSKDAAMALFADLNGLAKQENVVISIGPAMGGKGRSRNRHNFSRRF